MAIENETADQVVRMILQGSEVVLRLSGEAALRIAPMIYATEKLRILHDFYRQGDEISFEFDMAKKAALGHDFRDYICPDTIERANDYIKLGEKYVRVLFLKDYGNYISDDIIAELTDMNRNLMLSIDVLSVKTILS